MRFDNTILFPMTVREAAILLKYLITTTPDQEHQNELFNVIVKLRKLVDETDEI